MPVIVALLHDVLITVGVYALLGREVTTSTVAAVLTVLGYSIYDTIIIFDRVRENIPLMRRASFATIANVSLWETIRRSLATTFITLLPIVALLLFGGATLKDFAFALFVGIALRRLLVDLHRRAAADDLKEREPEYARRIGEESPSRRRGGGARGVRGGASRPSLRPSSRPVASGRRAGGGEPARRRSASAAGSGDARGPMAAPAELRELAEKLVLAGVGAVALTAERADELADELSARGGMGRDEARALIEELVGRWRGDASGSASGRGRGCTALFRELGLVTRDELEELELRVAQLEHRLRLLEAVNPLAAGCGSVEDGVVVRPPHRAARWR